MSTPLGAHDIFAKRSFESVIVGYILSLESYVTAPFGRYLLPTEREIYWKRLKQQIIQ